MKTAKTLGFAGSVPAVFHLWDGSVFFVNVL